MIKEEENNHHHHHSLYCILSWIYVLYLFRSFTEPLSFIKLEEVVHDCRLYHILCTIY